VNELDNTDLIAEPEQARPAGPTLGLLLRKAREARGMSINDVVHALKFSARQIDAVESDRLDTLPGAVFQRGIVRSYARLVKLDPESLLGLIEVSAPAPEPEIRPPENMGNAAPRGGFKQIPPLVAVSVLLLFAAAVMAGWHYLGGGLPQMRTAIDSAKTTMEDVKQPTDTAKMEIQTIPPADNVENVAVAPVVAQTVSENPATPGSSVMPADTRRLSFEFSGQSWLEVKDASGLVILTGIYTSGTQSVAGRAPFEIIIGNAAVVAVRDDGHVVDLKPHTRSEVARLTLE
jgi:cytoskeleton protein RodZ